MITGRRLRLMVVLALLFFGAWAMLHAGPDFAYLLPAFAGLCAVLAVTASIGAWRPALVPSRRCTVLASRAPPSRLPRP